MDEKTIIKLIENMKLAKVYSEHDVNEIIGTDTDTKEKFSKLLDYFYLAMAQQSMATHRFFLKRMWEEHGIHPNEFKINEEDKLLTDACN